jgi:phytoene desaturase
VRPADIAVIGAGFAGLAASIRLQSQGYRVHLYESLEQPGGRAGSFVESGFTFDMGPTLITAPKLLRELWAAAGRCFDQDVELVPLEPYYRVFFPDGQYFDYGGEEAATERQIQQINPSDVRGYRDFLESTRHIHDRAFEDFAHKPFTTLGSFLRIIPELVRLGATRSVYGYTSRYLKHPRLRTIFSFHPLFIGGSPLRASAIYSMIPYLERQGGVHFARGGMRSLVRAMADLFVSLGGELHLNTPIKEIVVERGSVVGVRLTDNRIQRASAVVSNADVAATFLRLAPTGSIPELLRKRVRSYAYSMSCFLLYLGVRRTYPQLRHHTVIMPDRYEALIRDIFDGYGLPADLALYLHTPTRTDPALAPPGCESLYVLMPVPHLGRGIDWDRDGQTLRDRIIDYLEHDFGLTDLSTSIAVERRFTPVDFARRYKSWRGSAFSIEPILTQSAYLRPHNRVSKPAGLYLVGAGTHPGAGLPGALLSAEITAGLIRGDIEPRVARRPQRAGRDDLEACSAFVN